VRCYASLDEPYTIFLEGQKIESLQMALMVFFLQEKYTRCDKEEQENVIDIFGVGDSLSRQVLVFQEPPLIFFGAKK